MNHKRLISLLVVAVLFFAGPGAIAQSPSPSAPQAPLGLGFTYQGQLKNASSPVNGACDFQFSLWDAAGSGSPPMGGAQLGITQTLPITVTNGLFTVVLNGGDEFGNSAFTGDARWLQVAVRCPAGSGAYATLSPRQALTAAPYALALPGMRTQTNATSPNVIGGYSGNSVAVGAVGATIGGGGSAVSGDVNQVNADYATLGGGLGNTIAITGTYATIGGGDGNTASGNTTTISGGAVNSALGNASTIGGGLGNTITVTGTFATISGGTVNTIGGAGASIGGGVGHIANGSGSVIGGGESNTAGGEASTIGGGYGNIITTTAHYATISGGVYNIANGLGSVVSGGGYDGTSGVGNRALGNASTIGGGLGNTIAITGTYATIGGGLDNTASGQAAMLGGGNRNIASGSYSAVSGGAANAASGQTAMVGGGYRNTASGEAATVGGGSYNTAEGIGSTISGGNGNTAHGFLATIGGGSYNTASNQDATIGGGFQNAASGSGATVGGGSGNTASYLYATVGGGTSNTASGPDATVGGGSGNTASGTAATIPGGRGNMASGHTSFAAGCGAKAQSSGTFVWADSNCDTASITTTNQFYVRASGGVVFRSNLYLQPESGVILNSGASAWSTLSDRASKENFTPVSGRDILERLASVPIQAWNWKSQATSIRHIGPVAQDFYAEFNVGEDERHINTVDADGVALAAIQGLYQIVQEQDAQITALQARVAELEKASQSGQASAKPAPFNVFNLASVLAFAGMAVLLRQHGVRRIL